MDFRPSEFLKPVAQELAELLRSREEDAVRKDHLFGQLRPVPETRATVKDNDNIPEDVQDSIGVWKKTSADGKIVFRRNADHKLEWHAWANVHDIFPKGHKKRLILLGESVARGFLYDPYYNVAKELQAIITAVRPEAEIEVVDLARTGMPMSLLRTMVESCVSLEPDVVVIFGGNNWETDLISSLGMEDLDKMEDIFGDQGFAGIKAAMEDKFGQLVAGFLDRVCEVLVKNDIPAVFVIPEFNLKDWKSTHSEHGLMWMPEDVAEGWLRARNAAVQAAEKKDMERLGVLAREMITRNPAHPQGYEFLGEYLIHNKQFSEARTAYRHAMDILLFSCKLKSPRCFTAITDRIRTECPHLGIRVVDLPAIFGEEFPDHVADREQFLDYCHMTVQSIKLSMRYTASAVVEAITGEKIAVGMIGASDLFPENEVQAMAHFSAAIHHSHLGQRAEILQYHCNKAIGYSLKAKDPMMEFTDFATRRTSSQLCRSFGKIIFDGKLRQLGSELALAHADRRKLMDHLLVDAIAKALRMVNIDVRKEIRELRIREHGIGPEGVDLLESFYSLTEYNGYMDEQQMILYASRATESYFHFVNPGDESRLTFTLTCRTPGREAAGKPVSIHINDSVDPVAELPMSQYWKNHSFILDGGQLLKGVNKLVIRWPYTFQSFQQVRVKSYYRTLKQIYPVLGEIASFRVRVWRDAF